ncbi:hypothetical protein INT43_001513 [Umbelopsis isabellina]|uniref:PH domain-containing protein n=1 Tax=Mortierella isabellina TaxID=91625 RepID=A0A8H7PEW4_MORIS|nr:hypothetical protein INT43_001513 [Umbelopsis isabellina]
MAIAAASSWFDAVKLLDLDTISQLYAETPSITMFLTNLRGIKDVGHLFGPTDECRVNALQWILWHPSNNQKKRQEVLTWLIQRSSPSELNDHRWGNGNTSLHIAAYMNELAAVQNLLKQGAMAHVKNGLNITACQLTSQEPILALLENKTDASCPEQIVPVKETAQISQLRSILRQTSSYDDDVNITAVAEIALKKKVTFNEAAEIRQFIELSSDEEAAPKRRRRGIFSFLNYESEESDEESTSSSEETEETEEGMEEEQVLPQVASSDDLDILDGLQEQDANFTEYHGAYQWEEFDVEDEDDELASGSQDDITPLSPTSKRMDLEDDLTDTVLGVSVRMDEKLLNQTLDAVRSGSNDSLLKSLIASPEADEEVNDKQKVTLPEEKMVIKVFEAIEKPINTEEQPLAIVEVTPESVETLQQDIEESETMTESLPNLSQEPDNVLEEGTAIPVEVSSKTDECLEVIEEVEALEEALEEVNLKTSDEVPQAEVVAIDEASIVSEDDESSEVEVPLAERPTCADEETISVPQVIPVATSTASLSMDDSLTSSEASFEVPQHRSQVRGSQRMRWESDLMSPVDTESPMSFASIFAANKAKTNHDTKPENITYMDLLLPQDEPEMKVDLNDIAVKPLPAIPSEHQKPMRRMSSLFQKLSNKKRIAPSKLKDISFKNLKRQSLEWSNRRSSSEDVKSKQADGIELTNSITTPPVASHIADKQISSGEGSDDSDVSNLFDNDSQADDSTHSYTPPSSPSPSGSLESEQKRLTGINSVKRRQSMPNFPSTNDSIKYATRDQQSFETSDRMDNKTAAINLKLAQRHSSVAHPSRQYQLDLPNDQLTANFDTSMRDSLERISNGQKPKMYTERYQQNIVHLSQPTFDPSLAATSPSWKTAQNAQKGGTFTKSRLRSSLNSTKSLRDVPGKLYVRLVAVQDTNVPIPSEPTYVRAILNDGTYEHLTKYVLLGRHMQFDQEFKISANSRLDFSLSLHVRADSHVKPKTPFARLLANNKKAEPELSNYVNRSDGSIGVTRISFGDMIDECRSKLCSATFPCQNEWFLDFTQSGNKVESSQANPRAIGKLVLHMVYLPETKERHVKYPRDIDDCMKGFDARRWHESVWRVGNMSQMGGDINFWRRRYYKAVGARLLAYHDTHLAPRAAIDLTQVIRLTSNGKVMFGHPSQSPDQSQQLLQPEEDSVKNSFQFTFSNGEKIDFFCDTERERDLWVNTLSAAIRSMPQWPDWLVDGKENIQI